MNLQLYEKISKFETYYMIYKFTGKITDEELSKILNCNIENIYNYITTSEVKLLEDFLNSGDHNEFITNCLKKEFSNMEPRDIANNIFEFFHAGIFDQSILDAIPEPAILLDYLDENNNDLYLFDIIDIIDPKDLFNYINNDGKSKDKIIAEIYSNYEFISNINFIEDSLQHIYDDSDRTKLLIYSKLNQFLPYIENPYYRNQVINACTKFEFDENELVENMKLYQFHEQAIAKLKTEDDITEYISTIDDPDIKLTFLEPIKKKENRNTIISSFASFIDEDLADIVALSQSMIKEFFEDNLGNEFSESQKEKMDIIFNRTPVYLSNLESNINGRANNIFKTIQVSNQSQGKNDTILETIIHEYAHLFSFFDYNTTENSPEGSIEEGMADLLADLAITHYIDKHGSIEIDGKKIELDFPYESHSGYNYEAAWPRTMLYGLQSSGKDIKALAEYLLGDKSSFCDMIFGKGNPNNFKLSPFGMPIINTNRAELYNSPELDFSNIDINSFYYRRNHILPLFELQNRLANKNIDLVGILNENKCFDANYIANVYFDNRPLHDISKEEMEDFLRLLDEQIAPDLNASAITNVTEYKNKVINILSNQEKTGHSARDTR